MPFKEKGRSKDGLDCWGLVKEVYKNELNILLNDYSYSTVNDRAIEDYELLEKSNWIKVDKPKLYDVILFKSSPLHVGIYLTYNKMLHTTEANGTVIESFNTILWINKLQGIYRYVN